MIEINGTTCQVRHMSKLILNLIPLKERQLAEDKLQKKRCVGPRKNTSTKQVIANCSLSNFDIANWKKEILQEARATIEMGRLIKAETIGNEEEIVQDIACIIEMSEQVA
ncbi:hypothetical protein V6N13_123090 [Hibiscus sabdariffa]